MAQPGSPRYRRGHVPVHPFHLDLNRLRRIIGMLVPSLRVDSIVLSLHVVADNSKAARIHAPKAGIKNACSRGGALRIGLFACGADERYER